MNVRRARGYNTLVRGEESEQGSWEDRRVSESVRERRGEQASIWTFVRGEESEPARRNSFCSWEERRASEQGYTHALSLSLSLSLSPSLSSLSLSLSPSFFGGGGFSSRALFLRIFPLFCSMGGRLLIVRGENQGAFSRHQGQGARAQEPEHNNQPYSLFATFLFYFNIHYQQQYGHWSVNHNSWHWRQHWRGTCRVFSYPRIR